MSETKQRRARDRREAAAEREQNARQRAERNRARGEEGIARRHEAAADAQATFAAIAEQDRLADVRAEGDRLNDA